jgi:phi13 family phage major tail protein
MALIGLNNFWYSHLTEAQDGTPTYDGAKSIGKAVSCSVSISNNSASLYADDALAESDTSFQSGTVTLGVDDNREETFADLLGHDITEEGEVTYKSTDSAPWVAVARVLVKMVNNVRLYKAMILYKVKFAEPSEDETTQGETLEFSTPSIEGTIATLANGDWKTAQTFATKAEAVAFIQEKLAAPTTQSNTTPSNNG